MQSSLLKPSADQVDQKPPPSLLALPSSSSFASTSGGRANKSHKKRKRIPYTLVEASKGNHCPTPGCDGVGHLTGMYAMHFAVSGCPKAHGKTPEECRARRPWCRWQTLSWRGSMSSTIFSLTPALVTTSSGGKSRYWRG